MLQLEIPNCPICQDNSTVIDVVRTINPQSLAEVELRCCVSCGHWWHSSVPSQEELVKMYTSASPFVVSEGAKESYQAKTQIDSFHKYILARVDTKPGTYLEIGAGGGCLLRRFRSMNYDCYGVDPGQWVEDVSIFHSIDDIPTDLNFDIFVLQDVLEHVIDPLGMLLLLRDKANHGSSIYCSFPCNDSRPARAYKGKWAMVRPYGHLHYFSLASAHKMFSLAGFSVEDIRLSRITPIIKTLVSFNIRGLAYEFLKGGKDQIYTHAVLQ